MKQDMGNPYEFVPKPKSKIENQGLAGETERASQKKETSEVGQKYGAYLDSDQERAFQEMIDMIGDVEEGVGEEALKENKSDICEQIEAYRKAVVGSGKGVDVQAKIAARKKVEAILEKSRESMAA